jgi:hypothetical protein
VADSETEKHVALDRQLQDTLAQRDREIADAAVKFDATFRLASLVPVLREAVAHQTVSTRGIHLAIPDCPCMVRFVWPGEGDSPIVLVQLTDSSFEACGESFRWTENDQPIALARHLAGEMRRIGSLPWNFSPETLLKSLSLTLCKLIRIRSGVGGAADISPVIYLPNESWAITDYGIECLTTYYPIRASRLRSEDWACHVGDKSWADYDEIWDAVCAAEALFPGQPSAGSSSTRGSPTDEQASTSGAGRLHLFIASSRESLPVARALQENLERDIDTTVWDQDVFKPTYTALESLHVALQEHDFAVFVFAPDDAAKMRGHEVTVTRDNVIFELGLFMGARGRRRCFILKARDHDIHVPSDLLGHEPLEYDAGREDGLVRALGSAANKIRRAAGISK